MKRSNLEQAKRQAKESFKNHEVTYLGDGRWRFGRPCSSTWSMFITQLPQENLAITGDAGDFFFTKYRGIHWLRGVLEYLLNDEKGYADWRYIAEKMPDRKSIQDFSRAEFDKRKESAEKIIEADKKVTEAGEKFRSGPEDDDELEKKLSEAEDALESLFSSNYYDDIDEAKILLAWHKEHEWGAPDVDSEDLWANYLVENGYCEGGDYEMLPSFTEYSFHFYHVMYGMAYFFQEVITDDDGTIFCSLEYEQKLAEAK